MLARFQERNRDGPKFLDSIRDSLYVFAGAKGSEILTRFFKFVPSANSMASLLCSYRRRLTFHGYEEESITGI